MDPVRTSGWTHLDLDGEGVDEVLRDAVGVAAGVHAHGDELALRAANNMAVSLTCREPANALQRHLLSQSPTQPELRPLTEVWEGAC